jgi:hypothetical protein
MWAAAAKPVGQRPALAQVNSTLLIRKPNLNASIAKPQPWVGAGLRLPGEGLTPLYFI